MGRFFGTLDLVNIAAAPIIGARSCVTPKSTVGTSTTTPPQAPPTTKSTPSIGEAPACSSPESPKRTSPPSPKDKGKQSLENHARKKQWSNDTSGAVPDI